MRLAALSTRPSTANSPSTWGGDYEGIWVGEDSTTRTRGAYRNDVIAALKGTGSAGVAWPGGCFADEYNWREGIGPRELRPRKVNTHWGGVVEDNSSARTSS